MNSPDSAVPAPGGNRAAEYPWRRWLEWPGILVAVGLLGTMFAGILLRPIYFDERGNLTFIWLIAQGDHPYRDFWCTYPAAGFSFFMPLFRMLPDRAEDLIVLRAYSVMFMVAGLATVCLWSRKLSGSWWLPLLPTLLLVNAKGTAQDGLARIMTEFRPDAPAMMLAFVAIALLFSDARGWKRLLCVTCTIVSLAMMPKYAYVLLACHAFDLLGRWADKRLEARVFFEYEAGAVLGCLIAWALTWSMHATLRDVFHWSILVQERFQGRLLAQSKESSPFIQELLHSFVRAEWPATLAVIAGFCGFLVWAKRQGWRGQPAWIGYGLFVGVAFTIWKTILPFNQYLPPVFLPLLFYFPFLGVIVPPARRGLMEAALLTAAAGILLFTARDEARGIATSSLFFDLTQEDRMLTLIPPDERVLGAYGVIFRRPQTYVTYDEIWGDPPGFGSLVQDDARVAHEFTPARLRESLAQSKPGLIHLTFSLSPGWLEIAQDFLRKNAQSYIEVTFARTSDIRNDKFFVRTDLLKKAATAGEPQGP